MYFLVTQKSLKHFIHGYSYVAIGILVFIILCVIYIIKSKSWLKASQKKMEVDEILDSLKK
ncbi:MAG: hypothetical protein IKF82_01965 [Bacilli bacterium]|nr:hypothetical protein [Bacilli bacterium]MBR3209011.1 hypothetical protein [Bacilli bacterium]